jgi:hypothetical protein
MPGFLVEIDTEEERRERGREREVSGSGCSMETSGT